MSMIWIKKKYFSQLASPIIINMTRMPSSLPAQTELTVTTTIEEGKVIVPFKVTFTAGLKEW